MKRPLVWFMAVLVLGECSIIFSNAWMAAAVVLAALGACLSGIMTHRAAAGVMVFFLLAGAAAAGYARGSVYLSRQQAALQAQSGSEVTLQGVVVKRTDWESASCYLLKDCAAYGTVQAVVGPEGEPLAIGDTVLLSGKVTPWKEARNPGNFDQKSYYASQGVFLQLTDCAIRQVKSGTGSLAASLEDWRQAWRETLARICPEKEAGIFQSILLGDKSELDETVKDLYARNGISHILAISGLHISMIGMTLYRLLRRFFSRKLSCMPAIVCSVLFGMMTGSSMATVRAVIMLAFHIEADRLGRSYDAAGALSVAVIWILWENPGALLASGFQMSVLAVLGILLITPVLRRLWAESERGLIWKKGLDALAVSLGATLAVLPAQLWWFYRIPVYGVFLNLLVVPCMGAVLVSGLAGCLAGGISVWAGKYLILPGVWILRFYEWLCENAAALPGAGWCAGKPEVWQIVAYYSLFGLILFFAYRGKRGRLRSLCAAVCLLFSVPVFAIRTLPDCSVTMLDVGQGDCFVFRSGGKTLLLDGGSSSVSEVGDNRILPYLQSCGISELDCAVITHLDADHYNGILELLQMPYEMQIHMLAVTEQTAKEEGFEEIAALAEENRTAVRLIQAGDSMKMGNLRLQVLYPFPESADPDKNALSAVILADYGNGAWNGLFTGDLPTEGESEILKQWELPEVWLLKAGHHGSKTASGEELLQAIRPKIAWISAGENNRYGHPHSETLERLAAAGVQVMKTEDCGAVTLTLPEVRVDFFQKSSNKDFQSAGSVIK